MKIRNLYRFVFYILLTTNILHFFLLDVCLSEKMIPSSYTFFQGSFIFYPGVEFAFVGQPLFSSSPSFIFAISTLGMDLFLLIFLALTRNNYLLTDHEPIKRIIFFLSFNLLFVFFLGFVLFF